MDFYHYKVVFLAVFWMSVGGVDLRSDFKDFNFNPFKEAQFIRKS